MRNFLKNKINSVNAIRWALQEGNTTRTNQPGGLGLKLIADFIRMNRGRLQIASRYGYYEFAEDQEIFEKMKFDFPGTCINIEINTGDKQSYCLRSETSDEKIF